MRYLIDRNGLQERLDKRRLFYLENGNVEAERVLSNDVLFYLSDMPRVDDGIDELRELAAEVQAMKGVLFKDDVMDLIEKHLESMKNQKKWQEKVLEYMKDTGCRYEEAEKALRIEEGE